MFSHVCFANKRAAAWASTEKACSFFVPKRPSCVLIQSCYACRIKGALLTNATTGSEPDFGGSQKVSQIAANIALHRHLQHRSYVPYKLTMKLTFPALFLTTFMARVASADFVCNDGDTITGVVDDNVVIPPESTCTIGPGATINGDIEIKEGSTCDILDDVEVDGKVKAERAQELNISGGAAVTAVFHDDIQVTETAIVDINQAEINGDLVAKDVSDQFKLKFSTIEKDVEVSFAERTGLTLVEKVFNLDLFGNTIKGKFLCNKAEQELKLNIISNTIEKGLELSKLEASAMAVFNNILSNLDGSKTSDLIIEKNLIVDVVDIPSGETGINLAGNTGIKSLIFKGNMIMTELGGFGIFSNTAENDIDFEKNAWQENFSNVNGNCAGGTITVKRNVGKQLKCDNNNVACPGSLFIAEKNFVVFNGENPLTGVNNQCRED